MNGTDQWTNEWTDERTNGPNGVNDNTDEARAQNVA